MYQPDEQPERQKSVRRQRPDALGKTAFQGLELLQELVKRRKRQRISQTTIAARMGTSQSAVARIETGDIDIRLSTLDRYAAAIGQKIVFRIVRLPGANRRRQEHVLTEVTAEPAVPSPGPQAETGP
ncbi:MAG: helix-turn-helix domain-containing protein [Actinomycetota bacterium]